MRIPESPEAQEPRSAMVILQERAAIRYELHVRLAVPHKARVVVLLCHENGDVGCWIEGRSLV